MQTDNLRILIVAENASLKFGGEAALPLHYFRILRQRKIETWLIVHERTREELKSWFREDFERIYFIKDTFWHRWLWNMGKFLPQKLANFSFGLVMRLMNQVIQRRLAGKIVQEKNVNLIHQPIPVSPKEPSLIFGLGVPVVIGPMNGGMEFPPGFRDRESKFEAISINLGRFFANFSNILIPGKRKATTLLVANTRTQAALPKCIDQNKVVELVENGVDLSVWQEREDCSQDLTPPLANTIPKLVYIGRLVDWKALDILLTALQRAAAQQPVTLDIIGDGDQRVALEAQASQLGLLQSETVRFLGWLSQSQCAQQLQQADGLILPSLYECGGAVVLEAMAMGKAVIATNWGGPKDYLNSSCGILVEPSSPGEFTNSLAHAMVKLAQQPELRKSMGEAGRERIVKNFDWEVKVDTMVEIYQESIYRYSHSQASNQESATAYTV